MDLWQLQIFCKVVECKSFSEAGRVVHLSQPTVSSHIKDLEDHFKCRLIDRMAKAALPTKAGRLLYGYAKRMIALRDETESALAEFKGRMKGRLDLGGSTIPGAFVLPSLIGSFTLRYPEVRIRLSIADTRQIVAAILSGEVELGVVGAVSNHAGIQQRPILEDEMCLVVSAAHRWAGKKRIAKKDLQGEPFLVREDGSGTLASLQASLAQAGMRIDDLNVVARIGSNEAIRQGVKSHMGVSVLSAISVQDDVAAGYLRTLAISGLDLKRAFYLTQHRQRSLSPIGQAFNVFVENQIADDQTTQQSR